MRNVTLALGSFALGAVCMFFFGNHTSTVRQDGFAFAQAAPSHPSSVLNGNRFTPVVPQPPRMVDDGNEYVEQIIDLDGMSASNDIFKDSTFVYGGGAYSLRNAAISGSVNFQLIGAAANTAQFLGMFGLIGCPAKQQVPQVNPNTPIINRATLEKGIKGDFVSAYSGTE